MERDIPISILEGYDFVEVWIGDNLYRWDHEDNFETLL